MLIKTSNVKFNANITRQSNSRLSVRFPYNKKAVEWVKTLDGARWNPDHKIWTIADSEYNSFRLSYHSYLAGEQPTNPYARYDCGLLSFTTSRPLYKHQTEMVSHILTRRCCIFACEMGTGKTLAAIEAAEQLDLRNGEVWYVGPVSGVRAVTLELDKWNSRIQWEMFTYEGLKSQLKHEQPAPKMVIFDESSRIKNPMAQRSAAAAHLAKAIRAEHHDEGYVVCMSGTPAPKAPTDWWNQAQVTRPGFLAVPNIYKMKEDLCLIETRETLTGVPYPQLVTWWDNENKCAKCGAFEDEHPMDHPFVPSVNKVANLKKRLNGLVMIHFAADCLDLPELRMEQVRVKPTAEMLKAIEAIKSTSARAVTALSLIREIADGFLYKKEHQGEYDTCEACHGSGIATVFNEVEQKWIVPPVDNIEGSRDQCPDCNGTGLVPKMVQTTNEVGSPKDDVFLDELKAHEEVGRYIVWGGFTGTVDRLTNLAVQAGWAVLRVDGRGYHAINTTATANELLKAMDSSHREFSNLFGQYPKVCFVGHPKAGGMALTLTASPTSLFYSNCFDGEARSQAVKRGHRAGMPNRAHVIKDLIMVKSDLLVLENLEKKKRLQDLTMKDLI